MSMQDLQKVSSAQIDFLKKKQNRELSRLEEGHQELKVDLKKNQALEVVEIKAQNEREILSENERKEKILNEMKNNLDKTKQLTSKEMEALKSHVKKVKEDEQAKLVINREGQRSDNELFVDQMKHDFKEQYKKLINSQEDQISQMKFNKSQEFQESERNHDHKLTEQKQTFSHRFENDSKVHKDLKDDQNKQFKNERLQANSRQQKELTKLSEAHLFQLGKLDRSKRQAIKEQDLLFEEKYASTLKLRNEDLKRLDELNQKVSTKMKKDLSEKLVLGVQRSEDPFYRFTELSTEMKKFPDRVELKVQIPDHAKADVSLTINGKEALVHFNRRYDDSKSETNYHSKVRKVESFTSTVDTGVILDPKKIKSSYDNGVMTYVIERAEKA